MQFSSSFPSSYAFINNLKLSPSSKSESLTGTFNVNSKSSSLFFSTSIESDSMLTNSLSWSMLYNFASTIISKSSSLWFSTFTSMLMFSPGPKLSPSSGSLISSLIFPSSELSTGLLLLTLPSLHISGSTCTSKVKVSLTPFAESVTVTVPE